MNIAVIILVWVLALMYGGLAGLFAGYRLWGKKSAPVQVPLPSPTDDEIEKAKAERRELIEAQKAFQSMMGYNADIAYGIGDNDITAEGS